VAVIEADQRQLGRHLNAGPSKHVEQAQRTTVVTCEDRGRQDGFGEHRAGRLSAGLLGVSARYHAGVRREAMASHCRPIGATPLGRPRTVAAVDMMNLAMAEFGQVIHRLPDPLGVGRAHRAETA